jgi:excisionase family DNA binding protein
MSTSERPALLTVDETAELLRCSKASIYRRVSAGELPAVRLTGRVGPIRIVRSELSQWLDQRRTTA